MLNALQASWANYAVDIIAVVILLVYAFRSAAKGFVACLFGLISTIVAVVLGFVLLNQVLAWTNGLFGLQNTLVKACADAFAKIKGFDIDVSSVGIQQALADKKLPAFLVKIIVDGLGNDSVPQGTTLAVIAGGALGRLGAKLLAFLIIFALAKLLLRVLESLLSSVINAIPLVGTLNALLGFVVGALQGLLLVCGVVALIAVIPSPSIAATLRECTLVGAIYDHNPIHTVLGWLFN